MGNTIPQVMFAPQIPAGNCGVLPPDDTIRDMVKDKILDFRRSHMKALIDGQFEGNQSRFASAVGTAPPHINQILAGKKNVGEGLARRIEIALRLPPNSMDEPPITDYTRERLVDDGKKIVRHINLETNEETIRREVDLGLISRHMDPDRSRRYPTDHMLREDMVLEALFLLSDRADANARYMSPLGMYRPDGVIGDLFFEVISFHGGNTPSSLITDKIILSCVKGQAAHGRVVAVLFLAKELSPSAIRTIEHLQATGLLHRAIILPWSATQEDVIQAIRPLVEIA